MSRILFSLLTAVALMATTSSAWAGEPQVAQKKGGHCAKGGCGKAACGGRGCGAGLCGAGCHGLGHGICKHHRIYEGQDPWANCGCNGSYDFPVPPLYTYHWRGLYKQRLMTDYHSPWRFPAIKPFQDEDTADVELMQNESPTRRPVSRAVSTQPKPIRTAKPQTQTIRRVSAETSIGGFFR